MSISSLGKLLANQRFFLSDSNKARAKTYALQTKAIGGVIVTVREKSCLDAAKMTFKISIFALSKAATE